MRSSPAPARWVAFRKPNRRARLRLFCFPFAGGGASIYRAWRKHLPPEIEVCPVQPPGRENRLAEPPLTRMEHLSDALSHAIRPCLDLPFAMFGHSMGAVVGYETARRLEALWGKSPVHLIVSARLAPHVAPRDEPSYTLSDRAFIEKLEQLKGTPQEVLGNRELMALLLPVLRADFELNDTYISSTREALVCPVTAFGATDDDEVTEDDLSAWRSTTKGPFQMRVFPGDHFFILRRTENVVAAVREVLLPHL